MLSRKALLPPSMITLWAAISHSLTLPSSRLFSLFFKFFTPELLVGMQAGIPPLDISMAIYQKIRKQSSSIPRNTIFGYKSKRCSIVPQ